MTLLNKIRNIGKTVQQIAKIVAYIGRCLRDIPSLEDMEEEEPVSADLIE